MKIAVIGTGRIGRLRAETVAENPSTELVAVVDVDRASVDATAGALGVKSYTDYREMIDAGGLDAVIVSSPIQFHEEQCRAAFEAGCHVLVEKPVAPHSDACRRIRDHARAAGRTLAVGFNHRYYPSVKFLKQCIDEGRIGKLDHLRVFGGHDGLPSLAKDWMYEGRICGGGAMMDAGIHVTDLARYVAGEVNQVYGIATGTVWNIELSEDNAMAVFRTDSGVGVHYQASWTEWRGYHFFVDAYGDLGMVRAYYAPMFNLLVTHDKPGAPRTKHRKLYPEIMFREKFKGWQSTSKQTFVEELADFLRMVDGATDVPLADGWDGIRSVEVAEAVYRSHREGKAVDLPQAD